jgi:transcriptional regulator with XRE-family HTH domain
MVKTESAAALRLRLVVTEHQEGMGRRMRARREALGLSRDEVARRMGSLAAENGDVDKTNGNAIYRYENGEVTPGPKKLDLLARALGTQVAAFMLDEPKEGTAPLLEVLDGDTSKLDEALGLLRQLLSRQESLAEAVAGLVERLDADQKPARSGKRRAS